MRILEINEVLFREVFTKAVFKMIKKARSIIVFTKIFRTIMKFCKGKNLMLIIKIQNC
jgi:hypothetical protein